VRQGERAGPDEAVRLERVREALRRDDLDEAARLIRDGGEPTGTAEERAGLHLLVGDCLARRGRYAEALASFESGLRLEPDARDLLFGHGCALFHLWRFEAAVSPLQRIVDRGVGPTDAPELTALVAMAGWYLAFCLDRMGRPASAEEHFRRAHALAPETYCLPVRVERADFDRLVRSAIDSLPQLVKDRVGEIECFVADYQEVRPGRDPAQVDPLTLGFFAGYKLGLPPRQSAPRPIPTGITLYQRSLEATASSLEELEEEIRTTVYHEIGHFLGLDEAEVAELGL